MTDSDARLVELLDELVREIHPEFARNWTVDPAGFKFRLDSPPEPCAQCGQRVYLILPHGSDRPRWVRIGGIRNPDSLFPTIRQIRHECGEGDSWSVEAALFVESAMAAWGVGGGPDAA
jgi:hypothetical protein